MFDKSIIGEIRYVRIFLGLKKLSMKVKDLDFQRLSEDSFKDYSNNAIDITVMEKGEEALLPLVSISE